MFKSPLFTSAFATVVDSPVELYNTDGAQGAARGAGVGAGIYASLTEAFANLSVIRRVEPDKKLAAAYSEAYARWISIVNNLISK